MIVVFAEAALQELAEARSWYVAQQPDVTLDVGEAFLAAVQSSIARIEQYPFLARKLRTNVYRALMQDFPYAII